MWRQKGRSDPGWCVCCRYLGFLKGLVDSDTLPLSVSREALQEHAALKVIKKKVVRKTLDTLKQLAESDKETAGGDPYLAWSVPLCSGLNLKS